MARQPTKAKAAKPEAVKTPAQPKAELPRNEAGNITVPRFTWNGTPEGLIAKSVLVVLADGTKTLPKGAADKVRELVPGLADAYRKGTVKPEYPNGRDLTNAMITGRHQYMWFTAARGGKAAVKGEQSREHPLHENCNAAFAATYQAVLDRGIDKPFTAQECASIAEVVKPKTADDKAA